MRTTFYTRLFKNTVTSSIGLLIVIAAFIAFFIRMIATMDFILLLCLGIIFLWSKNSLVTDLIALFKSALNPLSNNKYNDFN
jgi:multisubunit Na+/H+ antiporter MnhG subunit